MFGVAMPVTVCVVTVLVVFDRVGWQLSMFQQVALGMLLAVGILAVSAIHNSKNPLKAVEMPERVFTHRKFTTDDLAWYDGVKNTRVNREKLGRAPTEHPLPEYDGLIFVGVRGTVYSVSSEWYGPESPYHAFVGRDSSRHLGKVVVGNNEANCDWRTLSKDHLTSLTEWEEKFKYKYQVVGTVEFGDDFETKAAQFEP
jgi:hypothetical protein